MTVGLVFIGTGILYAKLVDSAGPKTEPDTGDDEEPDETELNSAE
jgi:hypothetical protein